MGDCWPESDAVHAWVADHGLQDKVSNEDMHALAEKVTEERVRLQKQIDSIATMLGWGNTPPAKSLEDTIRAIKARGRLTEDELQEARTELRNLKDGWRNRLQLWAKQLGMPGLEENSFYTHGGVARQIALWQKTMEFYGLLGNWQGYKNGMEASACENDMGSQARAALGKPDREVPEAEEDKNEVYDNGHDRAVCACVDCRKFRDEHHIPEKPHGLARYIPNDGHSRERAGWDELYLHAEAADIFLEEALGGLNAALATRSEWWKTAGFAAAVVGHVLQQNTFDTAHERATCACTVCETLRKEANDGEDIDDRGHAFSTQCPCDACHAKREKLVGKHATPKPREQEKSCETCADFSNIVPSGCLRHCKIEADGCIASGYRDWTKRDERIS